MNGVARILIGPHKAKRYVETASYYDRAVKVEYVLVFVFGSSALERAQMHSRTGGTRGSARCKDGR